MRIIVVQVQYYSKKSLKNTLKRKNLARLSYFSTYNYMSIQLLVLLINTDFNLCSEIYLMKMLGGCDLGKYVNSIPKFSLLINTILLQYLV